MANIRTRLNIIFTAFLFSSLVYLLVGFALTKSGWTPILQSHDLDKIIFGVLTFISIALVAVLFMMKKRTPAASDVELLSKSVFLFAIAEAPAILGLVVFLLTGNLYYLLALCIISLCAFASLR